MNVSQGAAELNTAILSQCNNIVSLKVTDDKDKFAVEAMLTDLLVRIVEMLPNLDVGECLVVRDAICYILKSFWIGRRKNKRVQRLIFGIVAMMGNT